MRRNQRTRKQKIRKREYIKPLSNYEILHLIKKLKIPHFCGVFMRDTLSKRKNVRPRECWIINHGSSNTEGSHWTALAKNYNTAFYFDSFGKLPPPFEIIDYLNKGGVHLYYNAKKYQKLGTVICGHLCLKFLHDFWKQLEK